MMELADVGLSAAEQVDRGCLGLSDNEHRLILGYRRMTEQERRQIRRLVSQLADTQEE